MKKSRAEKSLEALLDKANEKETLAEAEVRIRQLLHEEARTLARQCTIHRQEVQDALETAREIQKDTQPAPEQAGQVPQKIPPQDLEGTMGGATRAPQQVRGLTDIEAQEKKLSDAIARTTGGAHMGKYRSVEEALIDQVECLECGAIGTADERACFCSEHGEAYDTTQREET